MLAETAADPVAKRLLPSLEARARNSAGRARRLRAAQDASERCRELTASLLLRCLERAPDAALAMLPYLVPVLLDRLGSEAEAAAEPSEARPPPSAPPPLTPPQEVRLLLTRLAAQLLQGAQGCVAAYTPSLAEMLGASLSDAAPDVAAAGCAAAADLARAPPARLGAARARSLARAATPLLGHRSARLRLASLSALDALQRCGAQEHLLELCAAPKEGVPFAALYGCSRVSVNWLAALACDRSAAVRARFHQLAGGWARAFAEHAHRLLPYLLWAAQHEPDAGARAAAAQAMDDLAAHAEARTEGEDESDEEESEGRPRAGARTVVRESLSLLLPACVAELRSCAAGVRPRAAALLLLLLRHGERASARHAQAVIPALCLAAGDEDGAVRLAAEECAATLARWAPRSAWEGALAAEERRVGLGGEAAGLGRVREAMWAAQGPAD